MCRLFTKAPPRPPGLQAYGAAGKCARILTVPDGVVSIGQDLAEAGPDGPGRAPRGDGLLGVGYTGKRLQSVCLILAINQFLKTASPMVNKTIKTPQVLIKRYNWDRSYCGAGLPSMLRIVGVSSLLAHDG